MRRNLACERPRAGRSDDRILNSFHEYGLGAAAWLSKPALYLAGLPSSMDRLRSVLTSILANSPNLGCIIDGMATIKASGLATLIGGTCSCRDVNFDRQFPDVCNVYNEV